MSGDHASHERFLRSLDRALGDPAFLDRFYEGFIAGSDAVRAVFRHTDMASLKRKLQATLELAAAVEGSEGTSMYLEHLGRVHARIGIDAGLYDLWLQALLRAVALSDPRFDPELEAIWRAQIQRAIDVLLSQYPRRAVAG